MMYPFSPRQIFRFVPWRETTFKQTPNNLIQDYRIFEDFAFYMIEQAQKKQVTVH